MPPRLHEISLHEAAGLLGVCLYVTAYALLQFRALRYGAMSFTTMNLCAAALVGVSLIEDFNLASALIQGMWVVMSLVGLARAALWPPRDEILSAGSTPQDPVRAATRETGPRAEIVSFRGAPRGNR